MHLRFARVVLVWACLLPGLPGVSAAALPAFDFRTAADVRGWVAQHDLSRLAGSAEGLVATISGGDPYFAGPARDYPAGSLLWLNLRVRSDTGGTMQVFHYRDGSGPTEPASVRFALRGGDWVTVRVPVPALGAATRLRIDPPGDAGTCVLERLWFEERLVFAAPAWPAPKPPALQPGDPAVDSGPLRMVHARSGWGAFEVRVADRRVAIGPGAQPVGYILGRDARWWIPAESPGAQSSVEAKDGGLVSTVSATDPDGARWTFRQTFVPGPAPGVIAVRSSLEVDSDRRLLHAPGLLLFPGVGTVGPRKQQALLAGVEYLEDEPGSSEADLEGVQARRQVTDTARLTFPLAVIVADDRHLGLAWEMSEAVSVLFDTPDRIFRSGGHVLGLLWPGSDGLNRDEGSLVPYDGLPVRAGEPLVLNARILGGRGATVVPAVQQYVSLQEWPAVPATGLTSVEYFRLAARGWLDSEIRDGSRYRHAVVGNFGSQPAADAACQMAWLADRVDDAALAERLRAASAAAGAEVPVGDRYHSGVGHVRFPVAPLLWGGMAEAAATATRVGQGNLGRFRGDGTVRYTPASGGPNYARTHWTNEANGLAAPVVVAVLEAGLFNGDRLMQDAGLRHLRGLGKFRGTVPRGAQTWEIPLHTPDILASGHLVRAYTLGYELTGDPAFLEEARYWAWTGIPFVYLRAPVDGPVGPYATTPVLGATQWVAPNWIGLPVQWCGLVYADALEGLARHDPGGPWRKVAAGIVASGIQQTYPATSSRYLGLLPDSFSLRPQQRNPANINPGTLLAVATRTLGAGPLHDLRHFHAFGVTVQAAGSLEPLRADRDGFAFRVRAWPREVHRVLLNGVFTPPGVRIDGRELSPLPEGAHLPGTGWLILEVRGSPEIEIRMPARTALQVDPRPAGVRISWPLVAPAMRLEARTWPAADVGAGPGSEGTEWRPVEQAPLAIGDRWRVDLPWEPVPPVGALFRLRGNGG